VGAPSAFGTDQGCWMGSALRECLHEPRSAEQVDHAFEVVGHDSEANLGAGAGEAARQEAGMAEDAVLECGVGMFDRRSSEPHDGWRCALVHAV
jgi:hypothetical protein